MKEKIGLICEGGGTKVAYTCGVLNAFLDNDIHIPYCVGISAGAEVLVPYVSRQVERLKYTATQSASQDGAIGLKPLIKEKGLFGINFICDLLEEKYPLDCDTFYNSDTELEMGVYNIDKDQVEYYGKKYYDAKEATLVKASCALAMINRPVKWRGSLYMDAGIVDMISIQQSINYGNDKHIVISCKEEGYVRKAAPKWQLVAARIMHRKEPKVKEYLRDRHLNYAKQWDLVDKLQKEGKALVLRPSQDYGISRYTHDSESLTKWYELGYEDTMKRIDEIKAFINE